MQILLFNHPLCNPSIWFHDHKYPALSPSILLALPWLGLAHFRPPWHRVQYEVPNLSLLLRWSERFRAGLTVLYHTWSALWAVVCRAGQLFRAPPSKLMKSSELNGTVGHGQNSIWCALFVDRTRSSTEGLPHAAYRREALHAWRVYGTAGFLSNVH